MHVFTSLIVLGMIFSPLCALEEVWKGYVSSGGSPTEDIDLELGQKYQIKVSGVVNLSYGRQNGMPLQHDACYEFNMHSEPNRLLSFKNSLNIPVFDGKYHPDHVYVSAPFFPSQNKIHFWISDGDYKDNTGSLKVEVTKLDNNLARKKGANLEYFR